MPHLPLGPAYVPPPIVEARNLLTPPQQVMFRDLNKVWSHHEMHWMHVWTAFHVGNLQLLTTDHPPPHRFLPLARPPAGYEREQALDEACAILKAVLDQDCYEFVQEAAQDRFRVILRGSQPIAHGLFQLEWRAGAEVGVTFHTIPHEAPYLHTFERTLRDWADVRRELWDWTEIHIPHMEQYLTGAPRDHGDFMVLGRPPTPSQWNVSSMQRVLRELLTRRADTPFEVRGEHLVHFPRTRVTLRLCMSADEEVGYVVDNPDHHDEIQGRWVTMQRSLEYLDAPLTAGWTNFNVPHLAAVVLGRLQHGPHEPVPLARAPSTLSEPDAVRGMRAILLRLLRQHNVTYKFPRADDDALLEVTHIDGYMWRIEAIRLSYHGGSVYAQFV